MSLIDLVTLFTEKNGDSLVVATGTSSANTIDTGTPLADLSGNYRGAGYVNIIVKEASDKDCEIVLQDSDDNAIFADVVGATIKANAVAGTTFTVKIPKNVRRYLKMVVKHASQPTSGSYVAYIGNPETDR